MRPSNVLLNDQTIHVPQPVLILAMVGFSRDQEHLVGTLLEKSESSVRWRLGTLREADAWWINGARTQLLGDGSIRIGTGEPGGRSVRLSLEDVERPIAFAEPLASSELEPAYRFSIDEEPSMRAVLATLHTQWLAGMAAQLWLAAYLVAAEGSLAHRVYHVTRGGRLLAVLDRTGAVGLAPGISVGELQDASWSSRPSAAGGLPPSFDRTTVSELVWSYAVRAETDLLPARYRSRPIYFRRPPRIPQRLLGDDHLIVMRELSVGPASFARLLQRTRLASEQLAWALAALYLTGSVTSNARKAIGAAPVFRALDDGAPRNDSLWSPTGGASAFSHAGGPYLTDFTVPAGFATIINQEGKPFS